MPKDSKMKTNAIEHSAINKLIVAFKIVLLKKMQFDDRQWQKINNNKSASIDADEPCRAQVHGRPTLVRADGASSSSGRAL